MTLRQLEIFTQIAENLSFKIAAEELYISPSAVTQQMNNLEQELGTRLFIRDSKNINLTPAGYTFLSGATEILEKVDSTVKSTILSGKVSSSSIFVGYIGLSAAKILSQTIKIFHSLYPGQDIQLLPCDPLEIPSLLKLRSIDIALLASSYLPYDEDIVFEKLIDYKYSFVLFKSHPLVREKTITAKHIADYKLVVPKGQYIPGPFIERFKEIYGAENLIMVHSQSEMLVDIRTHDHIGIMPEYLYLSRRDIISKPLSSIGNAAYGFVTLKEEHSLSLNNYINCMKNGNYSKESLFGTSAIDIFK